MTVAVVSGIATDNDAGAMQMNMMYCPLSLNCGQPSESYHQNGAVLGLPEASAHDEYGKANVLTIAPLVRLEVDISSR